MTISPPTLIELVSGVLLGARGHVLDVGWAADQKVLVVTLDGQRWTQEVQTRQRLICDRLVLFGHPRPNRLVVVTGARRAVAA